MSAKDEEEKAEAGEVEKERGVMPEDEEVEAEGGEVEKERKMSEYQCNQCGKKYAYMHKLKHHITWLCKEHAPRLLEVEPRRKFSSNIYQLPSINEREEEVEKRGEEPGERTAREEEEGEVRHEEELNLTSGSVAPQVMIYQAQY